MATLIRRVFTVSVASHRAWDHLAHVKEWPSWAPNIKRIELQPSGEIGPQSTGFIQVTNGLRPKFRVTEFNRPRYWKYHISYRDGTQDFGVMFFSR